MVELYDVWCGVNCAEIKLDALSGRLDRIEAKLDALLTALADEEVEADEPAFSLDGEPLESGERNQDDEL